MYLQRVAPVAPVRGGDISSVARLPIQCNPLPVVTVAVIIPAVLAAAVAAAILRRNDSGDDLKVAVRILALDALEV